MRCLVRLAAVERTQFNLPYGVAADRAGVVYVADRG
jgi:hypothetical protein